MRDPAGGTEQDRSPRLPGSHLAVVPEGGDIFVSHACGSRTIWALTDWFPPEMLGGGAIGGREQGAPVAWASPKQGADARELETNAPGKRNPMKREETFTVNSRCSSTPKSSEHHSPSLPVKSAHALSS